MRLAGLFFLPVLLMTTLIAQEDSRNEKIIVDNVKSFIEKELRSCSRQKVDATPELLIHASIKAIRENNDAIELYLKASLFAVIPAALFLCIWFNRVHGHISNLEARLAFLRGQNSH